MALSDEESRNYESEEEVKHAKKRPYEDDEDDEDEEDEEEEEDEGVVVKKKRFRSEPRNQFLDVEAAVSDDDEDYDDEDEGLQREDGFIEDQPDDEEINTVDDRLHREVDRRREAIVEEDAEKLASEYREKYGRSTASKYRGDTGNVPQRLLLPSVQDPNIWGVRCKYGKERELVRLIMKKMINLQKSKTPLEIFSAFQRDGFLGYIYIEARKVTAVDQAIKGFANIYGQNKVLVPIKEYTDLLRVNKSKEQELTPGTYVRVKRGKYQRDLAIVENLSENGLEARIKLVPRLDYGKAAALNKTADGKRKPTANSVKNRPAPRLFSEYDAVQYDQRHLTKRGPKSFFYHNELYENGFLLKDYKLTYLDTENIKPTLDELQRFNGASDEGIDLTALAQTLKNDRSKASFQTGDDIEIFSGEQAGVEGRVLSTHGEIVTIEVTSGPLAGQQFEAPSSNLRKRFSIGEHVRVSSGNYSGQVGMVVGIDKDSVTIVDDSTRTELVVFSRDLQGAADVADIDEEAEFALLDLVQITSQTVGCVVSIGRTSLTVLTQEAHRRTVPFSSVIMKHNNSKRSFATDSHGHEIRVGDTVKEMYGEGRTGVILHIHRKYLFLQDRNTIENLGVFVASINSVTTVTVKGARIDTGKHRADTPSQAMGDRMHAMNKGNRKQNNVPIRQGGRDKIIGRLVTIGKGSQYKGLKGTVRDTTDTMARVELESKAKTVTVSKTSLLFKDNSGKTLTYTEFVVPKNLMHLINPSDRRNGNNRGGSWNNGSRTPASGYGGRTPGWADGGRTPAAGGSRTPGWRPDSAFTPAWNGSKTPAYGDSGRQSAWGDGSRTSAWNASARTPAYGQGNRNVWDAGSRTPGVGNMSTWDANSSSNKNYNSDRSRSWYDGSRPDVSAPTPGVSAPTPGFADSSEDFSAPTPGVFHNDLYDTAPTPGGYDAKTPGNAMPATWASAADAETPRYEPGSP